MFWAAFLTKIAVVRRGRCMCVMNRFLTSARLYLALSSRLSQHFPQQCMPGVFAGGPQACCSWQKKQKQKLFWRTQSVCQSTPSFSSYLSLFCAALRIYLLRIWCALEHMRGWVSRRRRRKSRTVKKAWNSRKFAQCICYHFCSAVHLKSRLIRIRQTCLKSSKKS